MKKSVLLCMAALVLGALPCLAQENAVTGQGQGQGQAQGMRGQRMSADEQAAQLAQQLGLDDSQKTQLAAILKEQSEEMDKLRQEYAARIKNLLNSEQVTKYEELQSRRGPGGMGMGGPGGPGGQGGPGGAPAANATTK